MRTYRAIAAVGVLTAAMVATPIGIAAQTSAESSLRVRIDSIEQFPHVQPSQLLVSMIFDGLYRYDDHYAPVPNLVAEPCTPDADGTTLTCRLIETTFHDGAPLTADDVAYTYQIASGACPPWLNFCIGGDRLSAVDVIDEDTVRFRLPKPDATFVTEVLPFIKIARKADIEASYARFAAAASTVPLADVTREREALEAVLGSDDRSCTPAVNVPETLLRVAGALLYDRVEFRDPVSAAFDACAYAEHLLGRLIDLEMWHGQTGIDAVATAYLLLDVGRKLNGTGPWQVAQIDPGVGMTLEAFDGYHFGRPGIDRVEAVVVPDVADAVARLTANELDISSALPMDLFDSVRDDPDLRFARFPDTSYFYMGYNVREGLLFSDVRLRQAVAHCVDKVRIVEAATADAGIAIESDILPASWAYQPELQTPDRDVAAGRALIEAAGWVAGTDGIYERDGKRLTAEILTRADDPGRLRFAELVALQAADCGMELVPRQLDFFAELLPMMETYPHLVPGGSAPYDLVMGGLFVSEDPDGSDIWHSRSITTAADSTGFNRSGFSDPRVDELLDAALATYDLRARARDYREIQLILSEQQPALFGWSDLTLDVLHRRVASSSGPIDLGRPNWWWRLEDLVLEPAVSG